MFERKFDSQELITFQTEAVQVSYIQEATLPIDYLHPIVRLCTDTDYN